MAIAVKYAKAMNQKPRPCRRQEIPFVGGFG